MFLTVAGLLLAGCAPGDRGLRSFEAGAGPDEFSVLPQRELTLPESLSALPPPTPGGTNITDPTPRADAIAALGGRPAAARAGGVPAADAALVAAAGRNGVDPTIRAELAEADRAFRERRARFSLFGGAGEERYFRAYAPFALDARAELRRFRNMGVATPTAPPAE